MHSATGFVNLRNLGKMISIFSLYIDDSDDCLFSNLLNLENDNFGGLNWKKICIKIQIFIFYKVKSLKKYE